MTYQPAQSTAVIILNLPTNQPTYLPARPPACLLASRPGDQRHRPFRRGYRGAHQGAAGPLHRQGGFSTIITVKEQQARFTNYNCSDTLPKPANLPINLIAQIAKKEKSEQEYYDNKYGFKVGRVLFNYTLAKPTLCTSYLLPTQGGHDEQGRNQEGEVNWWREP